MFGPQTLHYAKFWAQNATKTSAGNIPESLSNLFLRDNCHLLQRLLNNANSHLSKQPPEGPSTEDPPTHKRPSRASTSDQKNSRRLELLSVDFQKHPARKVGTRSRQCRPKIPGRFAFPGARSPRICRILRFGKKFPANFPGLSRSSPRSPRTDPGTATAFSSFLISGEMNSFPEGPARLMSCGKNCLPTVSRQSLTRNYPRPNCLLKCLPHCLSPTREGFLFLLQK